MTPSTDAISSVLGLASSAAWLGAQFPQLWTNYRLQSADGLALPFLANWLAGDTTNLVGCLLTHQLPFQTYLATYFVWIDTCLLGQYLYYEWYRTPSKQVKLEIDTSNTGGQTAPLTASPTVGYPGASTSSLPSHPHRSRLRAHSYTRQPLPLPDDLHDEVVGDELPAMTESFHSEHRRGASLAGQRGRGYDRADGEVDHSEERRKRVSQTSGRGASLVFLAVFGLWGFGFGTGRSGLGGSINKIGKVLHPVQYTEHPSVYFASPPTEAIRLEYVPLSYQTTEGGPELPPTAPPPAPPPSDGEPDRTSWTWTIGRISAWICCTLYLTSRMPQIWKNYTRQSVAGLSISLFVFAFLGNLFYVSSVLTSSKMFDTPAVRTRYLKDCLPYLLGSAGTFVFDFAIVIQSFVYRGLRPVTVTGGQPRRRYTVARTSEEEGLLGRSVSRRRSQSIGWVRRSPSMSHGRPSLDRWTKHRSSLDAHPKMRSSVEPIGRVGYGATQTTTQGQSGV